MTLRSHIPHHTVSKVTYVYVYRLQKGYKELKRPLQMQLLSQTTAPGTGLNQTSVGLQMWTVGPWRFCRQRARPNPAKSELNWSPWDCWDGLDSLGGHSLFASWHTHWQMTNQWGLHHHSVRCLPICRVRLRHFFPLPSQSCLSPCIWFS